MTHVVPDLNHRASLRLCHYAHVVMSRIVEILFGDCVLPDERRVSIHIQRDAMLISFRFLP
jgi:hypothetical protein